MKRFVFLVFLIPLLSFGQTKTPTRTFTPTYTYTYTPTPTMAPVLVYGRNGVPSQGNGTLQNFKVKNMVPYDSTGIRLKNSSDVVGLYSYDSSIILPDNGFTYNLIGFNSEVNSAGTVIKYAGSDTSYGMYIRYKGSTGLLDIGSSQTSGTAGSSITDAATLVSLAYNGGINLYGDIDFTNNSTPSITLGPLSVLNYTVGSTLLTFDYNSVAKWSMNTSNGNVTMAGNLTMATGKTATIETLYPVDSDGIIISPNNTSRKCVVMNGTLLAGASPSSFDIRQYYSNSTDGNANIFAVYPQSTALAGTFKVLDYDDWGVTSAVTNYGLYFNLYRGTTSNIGIRINCMATSGNNTGLMGYSYGATAGQNVGVIGYAVSGGTNYDFYANGAGNIVLGDTGQILTANKTNNTFEFGVAADTDQAVTIDTDYGEMGVGTTVTDLYQMSILQDRTNANSRGLNVANSGADNAANTHYGIYTSSTGTGSLGENYGLYTAASGQMVNYAGKFRATGAANEATYGVNVEMSGAGALYGVFIDGGGATQNSLWSYNGYSQLGGGTNYMKVDTTGHMTLAGSATYWTDLFCDGLAVRLAGSSDPVLTTFSGGTKLYSFADGSEKEVFCVFQLQHSWKFESTISPHVHWAPSSTNGGVCRWALEYEWKNNGGTYGSTSTVYVNATANGTAKKSQIDDFTDIAGTGINALGSVLVCRLYRNHSDGADTFTGDAFLLGVDIHIENDTLGSNAEYTK